MFHMDLALDRITRTLDRLGLMAGHPPLVHVLGTNGKGSTSLLISGLAVAHGLRCGLYTSPHFLDLRERARLDGRMPPRAAWLAAANAVAAVLPPDGLTYFEMVTAIALTIFQRAACDLAVLEAGLGGLHDATNALNAEMTLYAPIGLDHEMVIGPGLANIAADKAGAIKPGIPVLTGPQPPEALDILKAEARRAGTTLTDARDVLSLTSQPDGTLCARFRPDLGIADITGLRLALAGPHQVENARLALAGFALWRAKRGLGLDPEACRTALAKAHWPGRLQRVPGTPELILDGAHNPPALTAISLALREAGITPSALIFACLRDKNLDAMLPDIRNLSPGPILVPGLSVPKRAWPPDDLAARLGPRARAVPDLYAALDAVKNLPGPVLVAGSLYLLAEFFTLRPDVLGVPDAESGI